MYSRDESERVLGEALEGHREEAVVATKVLFQMREDDPNTGGLSRKTVEQELDASLDCLGIDTVDLYQTHRWDDDTSIEETLAALDDTVRRGKARYVGASSMWAHQLAEALYRADHLGYERFATMQNYQPRLPRGRTRDAPPLCEGGRRRHPLELAGRRVPRPPPRGVRNDGARRGAR